MLLLIIGNGYSSRMQIRICYDNHSYTETLHTDIKRMLKRYRIPYTVMKHILIDIQRSYADLISYVYTMYPYPELSGVCIPVVPKTAYATIADQFRVISMQYTTPHTVYLRAVAGTLISLSTSFMKRVISDTCILNHTVIYCKTIITHTISRHFCTGHAVSINSVELLESS